MPQNLPQDCGYDGAQGGDRGGAGHSGGGENNGGPSGWIRTGHKEAEKKSQRRCISSVKFFTPFSGENGNRGRATNVADNNGK